MSNELILALSLICIYAGVLVFYKFLGKTGLYAWTVIATVAANIEALIMVRAFGMDQTLGNILFASTFLVTDILSEVAGKNAANHAMKMGIFTNITFILISQSWFLYTPSSTDWASPAIRDVFSNTPRLMIVGIVVYAIAQGFDVWFYHYIWSRTSKYFGDSKRGLWIRNNGSTLLSQLLNTILFTLGAFVGIYDTATLIAIMGSSYVIFIVTSLIDTPVVYLARKLKVLEES
ncbi:MAG: queuosine precursor transporter [Eubacteriales bacterium]